MPSGPFIALSLLLAFLPSIFWMGLYLWEDREEPEPRRLLARLFAAGMIAACASVLLQEPIRRGAGGSVAALGVAEVTLIALIEKGTMLAAALVIAWRTRSFTQVLDGVIYLVAVALGFAFVENFFFFVYWVPQHADAASIGSTLARVSTVRFLLTTFLHTLTAGIVGLALGAARFTSAAGWLLVVSGFAVAVAMHAAFDAAVLAGYLSEAAAATAVLGLAFLGLLQMRSLSRPRTRP